MGFFDALFGKKPKVDMAQSIDAQAQQKAALQGNLGSFNLSAQLAGQSNLFNQQQQNLMNEMSRPGYSALQDSLMGITNEYLSGRLPQDVIDSIGRSTAQTAMRGGFGGTPVAGSNWASMRGNLGTRDLGWTSAQMQQIGMGYGQNLLNTTRTPQLFDLNQSMISPWQQTQVALQNEQARHESQQMAYNIAAQPNPVVRGLFDFGTGLLGAALGGMGGGRR